MDGFERYDQEREKFRNSRLYPGTYKSVIRFLYNNHGKAFHSCIIEQDFNLKGTEVREIIREGRRKGHQISSGQKGYWIELDSNSYDEDERHMEQRFMSMIYTIKLNRKNRRKPKIAEQLNLFN